MRLKEIKPGMVIHCKTEDEAEELLEHLDGFGYKWLSGKSLLDTTYREDYRESTCYIVEEDMRIAFGRIEKHENGIEFSDLIIPDMSAEEVLQIFGYICDKSSCSTDCPFRKLQEEYSCPEFLEKCYKKVVEICQQWKSEHEKKELEVETVDICRIIEIQPNGYKRCVHEEEIETELPFGGDEREKIEEILKRYCMEHEGNFIAVHEVVSRVKAVNNDL